MVDSGDARRVTRVRRPRVRRRMPSDGGARARAIARARDTQPTRWRVMTRETRSRRGIGARVCDARRRTCGARRRRRAATRTRLKSSVSSARARSDTCTTREVDKVRCATTTMDDDGRWMVDEARVRCFDARARTDGRGCATTQGEYAR